jgi:hypothetical protein
MIAGVVDTGDEALFQIFIDSQKFKMVPTVYSGVQGKLIHEKNEVENLASDSLLNTKIVEFQKKT